MGHVLVTELNELALMKQGQQDSRIGLLSPGLPGQPLSPLFSTHGLFMYLSPQQLTPHETEGCWSTGLGLLYLCVLSLWPIAAQMTGAEKNTLEPMHGKGKAENHMGHLEINAQTALNAQQRSGGSFQ